MIKTHNKTNLKYLCKHETSNECSCYKYKGSGTYWKRHLKVHGSDVNTKILYKTEDKELFNNVSFYYSSIFNIVESKEWANLTEEKGQGGKTITSEMIGYHSKLRWADIEYKNKHLERLRNNVKKSQPLAAKAAKIKLKGVPKTDEHKMNMRGKRPHVDQSGSKNNFAKKIITPFGEFGSIREASLSIEGYTYKMIWDRLQLNNEWRYSP